MANDKGYIVAWSNESFELWLCLHFNYIETSQHRKGYNNKLTDIFKNKGVFTQNQKFEDDGKNNPQLFSIIINQCGGSLSNAIANAKKLAENKNLNNPAKVNPATMVYTVIEALENY